MSPVSIYLDTNTIIALVEGPTSDSAAIREFIDASLARRGVSFHVSALCMAELLVMPYRTENLSLADEYIGLARSIPGLSTHPVSSSVLDGAAVLRAKMVRLKLPDAIHLATASLARCSFLLTFDKRIPDLNELVHPLVPGMTMSPVQIIHPDPASLAELSKALAQ